MASIIFHSQDPRNGRQKDKTIPAYLILEVFSIFLKNEMHVNTHMHPGTHKHAHAHTFHMYQESDA